VVTPSCGGERQTGEGNQTTILPAVFPVPSASSLFACFLATSFIPLDVLVTDPSWMLYQLCEQQEYVCPV